MVTPFIGEIRMFAGSFAPVGWAFCNGAIINVQDNDALFSVLGSTYGGNGRTTFGLPDLRGRVPIHFGSGPGLTPRSIGAQGGEETHTITTNEMASHTHTMSATNVDATSPDPSGNVYATARVGGAAFPIYADEIDTTLNADVISSTGGTTARNNVMPFQCLNFIIATVGIYPTQT